MKDRKNALLSAIIKEHVSTGSAVASKRLVDNHDFSVSPATIRNDMATLEKEGYIHQPHTSAGRIPTEKGWKHYIENFLRDIDLTEVQKKSLDSIIKQETGLSHAMMIKRVAKQLAEMSSEAVFVGFNPDSYYYTGLSNLFEQPEFQELNLVKHISSVVDTLDEVINEMFEQLKDGTSVMVGSDNPFGNECSSIVGTYENSDGERGIFGILGPLRMDYEQNLALIKHAQKLFINI